MTIRQRRALAALASGLTLKEAAKIAGYRNLETVSNLKRSDKGRAYLRAIADEIDGDAVFSVQDRLEKLKSLARVHQFSNPKLALGAVKEANRLIQ